MDISGSLEKILQSTELMGKRFYEQFLDDCPEALPFFEDVDMHRQAIVVTMALTLVEQYYRSPYPPTAAYFHYLGNLHQERGISQEMYVSWQQSMLKALALFHGEDWDIRLANQWQKGLEVAIQQIFQGYDSHVA